MMPVILSFTHFRIMYETLRSAISAISSMIFRSSGSSQTSTRTLFCVEGLAILNIPLTLSLRPVLPGRQQLKKKAPQKKTSPRRKGWSLGPRQTDSLEEADLLYVICLSYPFADL